MENNRKKYAELHLHSQDQFDSQNNPYDVCKRLKELGAEGFALTQHGVLSGIEPMKDMAKEFGLKFVPGIEAYYGNDDDLLQNKHLILLAKNYDGYRAIWKAVSNPSVQNTTGRAVMNDDVIKEYFGPGSEGHDNVFATSACINGVIAAALKFNDTLNREITKLEKRCAKYDSSAERMDAALNKVANLNEKITEATAKRDILEPLAKTKFGKRETAIKKLKKLNDPSYENEAMRLQKDKNDAEKAKTDFEIIKKEIASLKQRRTVFAKEARELKIKAEKETAIKDEIQMLQSRFMSDEELYCAATEETLKMVNIFGDGNFYMEIQNHGIPAEKDIYPVLAEIARDLEIPIVATNDVHTVTNSKDELLRRQILRSLRFEQWEEQQVGDDQLYIKTDEEMMESLLEILPQDVAEEGMNNIKVIFDQCNVEFPNETHYPTFTIGGKSSKEIFVEEIMKGIDWRFPNGIDQKYKDRLNREYKIIKNMGYIDYHLIVKDFLEYGRALAPVPAEEIKNAPLEIGALNEWVAQNGWTGGFTIGPGRGSAAGSLVCYVLGITNIDPFKYDLLFERFLNPERISMPDIDSDIANRIRPKIIEYLQHKYGKDSVCGIMTTNAQAPRGTIRIAAKYYGLSKKKDGEFLSLSDKMAKLVPNEPGISFDSEFDSARTVLQMLKEKYKDDKDAVTIIEWAKIIEGCFTAYGAHAAGMVISDGNPVSDYIPLRWNNKLGEMTTQVDMVKVEELGLLKMDLLGLKTLDIITDAIKMIQQNKGITIDPLQIPMDDSNIFKEIFAKARTNSVFQFESDGMKSMLRRFKPESFEDLIILVSMFRPGPLQYLDGVINVKNGKMPMTFLCPELKPILGKTYGAIVYQEQVMEIFQKLAGYTLGGADQVRRYMSKKKADKLAHEKNAFIFGDTARQITGCVNNGISAEIAEELFEQMTQFAKYAFNKSHAATYATNSYYTAWLKYYYPSEFLAAALNWAENDDIAGLVQEAKTFGVNILTPDINKSEITFVVENDKDIRFGLSSIKTVGTSATEIINDRSLNGPYGSLQEFFERTNVKKNAAENLILAGAFDEFYDNREAMASTVEPYKNVIAKIKKKETALNNMKIMLPFVENATDEEIKQKETEFGIPVGTVGKSNTISKFEKRIETAKKTLAELIETRDNITFPDCSENFLSRLLAEKELIGMYISAHPLDSYERNTPLITELIGKLETEQKKTLNNVNVLCSINDIKVRLDKNGNKFAIIDAEDKSATITLLVWSDQYKKFEELINENPVLIVSGKMSKKTKFNDEDSFEYDITVSALSIPKEKRLPKKLVFKTYKQFYEKIRELYLSGDKNEWIIYIEEADEFRKIRFKTNWATD